MPIPELEKFRQKYPEYNDMDDLTLATKLVEKYPEYSDLLDKVKTPIAKNIPQESIGQMLLKNLKGAAKETYVEGISPIVSGASTLAFGIPRLTARATGTEKLIYPEQKTLFGKGLRGVSEIAGFTGGGIGKTAQLAGKVIPKLAQETLKRKALRAGIEGMTAGVLSPPSRGFISPEERQKTGLGFGIFSAALPFIGAGIKSLPKLGRLLTGIEKETLDEVANRGYRNVLQEKYLNKKMPQILQERIQSNLDNLESAAITKYEDLTTPLRKIPFDLVELKGKVVKIATRVKMNPFKTDVSNLDEAILDGIVNKAQVKNLGDALNLRRSLDDIIYSNRGELRSSFGKQVRDLLNKELHKIDELKKVDANWTVLQDTLREGKKVLGETGEKFLARFSGMTAKQKEMLVNLERMIGGEPFIKDLTNWSLAKEFKATPKGISLNPFSGFGLLPQVTKPIFRGALRTGEAIGEKASPLLNRFNKFQAMGLYNAVSPFSPISQEND